MPYSFDLHEGYLVIHPIAPEVLRVEATPPLRDADGHLTIEGSVIAAEGRTERRKSLWCKHEKHMPRYDEQHTKRYNLTPEQVRRMYPRFEGECSECGRNVTLYGSWLHYLAGDW